MDLVDRFINLFRGRADVHGGWDGFMVKAPLTRQVFEDHLYGKRGIGVYPSFDTRCSWGCIDVDGKDFPLDTWDGKTDDPQFWDWHHMFTLASNLRMVLAAGNVPSHVEKSRNGYHVWVFPEAGIVSAKTMRRALMAACTALQYTPKEVNPKQEAVGKGERVMYGNYVRLPYMGYCVEGQQHHNCRIPPARYFVDDEGEPLSLHAFLEDGWLQKADTDKLEALAELWSSPERSLQVDVEAGLESVESILPDLDGLSYTIWKDGPLPGQDRSGTLARLAYKLRDNDTKPEDALAVLFSADQRWGKFHDGKHDPMVELTKILERAYG